MLKVSNKKIITHIARTTYKANKKRNLLTIFAIILTTFLITAVTGTGINYWHTVTGRNIMMSGRDYDMILTEPRTDQMEMLRNMEAVESAGLEVKCAMVTEGNGQYASMVKLYYTDKEGWEKQLVPAFEEAAGEFPEKEEEIMLSTDALKELGIKHPQVGMGISLTYYNLTDTDSTNTDSDSTSLQEQGVFTKTFTLCGYFHDYSGQSRGFVSQAFYNKTQVKQTAFGQGSAFISLKQLLYTQKDIRTLEKQLSLGDRQIIQADPDMAFTLFKILGGLALLLIMILSAGYLFIYNTLYISISKDIRYYGQLNTMGMTSGQLKRLIYTQALWNSLIGIPLGLLAGNLITKSLIPMAIQVIYPGESAKTSGNFILDLTLCFTAGAFAAITIIISVRKPAAIAGECTLIDAMRYTGLSKKKQKRKKIRPSENGVRAMAWRYMFRNKKQAAVILGSFCIMLTLFLVVNILIAEYDSKRVLNEVSDRDIAIENDSVMRDDLQLITSEKLQELKAIEGVANVRTVGTAEISIPYQEEVMGGYYERLYESRMTPGGNYEETMAQYAANPETDNNLFGSRLVAVDDNEFDRLNEMTGGELDEKAFKDGSIALIEDSYWVSPFEAVGKELSFYFPGKSETRYSVKIAAMCDSPAIFSGGYNPQIIVSDSFAERLLGDVCLEVAYVDYEEAFSETTEAQVKEVFQGEKRISFDSKLESYKNMSKTENQIKILGNGLGLLLAVLAFMNYLNMTATRIQDQSKEFAALESLGMTKRQIKKVLVTEGLGYVGISMVLSLIVGLPLGFVVFQGMNIYGSEFYVPVLKNLLVFGGIGVLCGVIPPVLYHGVQKGSLIDRMRKVQ